MGQYHAIYNKTKKEYLSAHQMCCGSKLLEFGMSFMTQGLCILLSNSNGRGGGDLLAPVKYNKDYTRSKKQPAKYKEMQEAIELVAGRWAGDEIVIQGDYAEENDKAYISEEEEKEYTNISEITLKALSVNKWLAEDIQKDCSANQYATHCFDHNN